MDADGNDKAGLRFPEIAVPLATYTGWNSRDPSTGSPTEIAPLQGSFFPFPLTKTDREKSGDPPLCIAERYPSRDAYLAKVKAAADNLVRGGYLLAEDEAPLIAHEALVWDTLTGAKAN